MFRNSVFNFQQMVLFLNRGAKTMSLTIKTSSLLNRGANPSSQTIKTSSLIVAFTKHVQGH